MILEPILQQKQILRKLEVEMLSKVTRKNLEFKLRNQKLIQQHQLKQTNWNQKPLLLHRLQWAHLFQQLL